MKYFLIAGEASGDLHGSNLMKGLIEVDNEAEFRFWGGDLMEKVGGELQMHYKDTAFMGLLTVILNLKTIFSNLAKCKQDILDFSPDVIILIDYPGFNLRIAQFAKQNNIKVFYYISPKIWAWKESRIKKIKAFVDKMYVIFPFEKDFYKKHKYPVEFAGNPLVDAIDKRENKEESFETFIKRNNLPSKPIIAILPGSRKQEISYILPLMLNIKKHYPKHQFVIAAASAIDQEFYDSIINIEDVSKLYNETYEILQQSEAALVTSGTATLETALLNIPQIVCYKFRGGGAFYNFAKLFLKVPYISLVNLIMNHEIVKELVQQYFTEKNVKNELDQILFNTDYRNKMYADYEELRSKVGSPEASKRFASLMYNHLKIAK
jgi:lipid-A-disaccharide synthase